VFPSEIPSVCALLSFVDNVVYGCYKIPLEVLSEGTLVYAEEKLEGELWKLVGHHFTNTRDANKELFMLYVVTFTC